MENKDFIPIYKEATTIKDLNHNMTQLIMVFNHNSSQMANDLKWIKRFVFAMCGFFGLITLGAIKDTLWGTVG